MVGRVYRHAARPCVGSDVTAQVTEISFALPYRSALRFREIIITVAPVLTKCAPKLGSATARLTVLGLDDAVLSPGAPPNR